MSGAVHGRVPHIPNHYPGLVEYEPLPFGEQAIFAEAFEAFVAGAPLSPQERQLAYAAGRAMWRASTEHGIRARGLAVRREMERDAPADIAVIDRRTG